VSGQVGAVQWVYLHVDVVLGGVVAAAAAAHQIWSGGVVSVTTGGRDPMREAARSAAGPAEGSLGSRLAGLVTVMSGQRRLAQDLQNGRNVRKQNTVRKLKHCYERKTVGKT
jgi:hypothetical protein